MPGATPNRNYPYPLGGERVDIAGDIKKLAEALDADIAALTTQLPRGLVAVGVWPQDSFVGVVDTPTNLLPAAVAFTPLAGRHYKATLALRAMSGNNSLAPTDGQVYADIDLKRNGASIQVTRLFFAPGAIGGSAGTTMVWTFDGDGVASTFMPVITVHLKLATVFRNGGVFIIEDMGKV